MSRVSETWVKGASAATAVALVVVMGACSDVVGGGDDAAATITFRSASASTRSLSEGMSLAQIPVTGGGHTVDVQAVDILFDRAILQSVEAQDDGDSETDSDSDGVGKEKFRAGAMTVALPLEGGTITPFQQVIPFGTYDELELRTAFVRARGTYDGQAFDVTVPVNTKFEIALAPPFVVDGEDDRPNVTVNVDALSWFRNSDGSVIDPRRLATDATMRAAFTNRIRTSFRAFEDSDRDGDDEDSDSDDSDSR